MRMLLLLTLLAIGVADALAQAARGGIAITVTDLTGRTLPGVHVEVVGSSDRADDTNESGQINFPRLQAGTYRLRFSAESVFTFEREVTLRANQVADLDIALTPAPPREEPPAPELDVEPAAAATPALGPAGQTQALSVLDLIERDFVGRDPRRESLLSCSGNARTTIVQLNEPLPDRIYDTGEATYYVLGGEGAIVIDGRETPLENGGFVSVPRGTLHAFTRRGRRPLILLATLSGAPCELVR